MIVCDICGKKIVTNYLKLYGRCVLADDAPDSDSGLDDFENSKVVVGVRNILSGSHYHAECLSKLLNSNYGGFLAGMSDFKPDNEKLEKTSDKALDEKLSKELDKESSEKSDKRPRKRNYNIDWDRAYALLDSGMSMSDVAKAVGCRYTTLWNHVKRFRDKDKKLDKNQDVAAASSDTTAVQDVVSADRASDSDLDPGTSDTKDVNSDSRMPIGKAEQDLLNAVFGSGTVTDLPESKEDASVEPNESECDSDSDLSMDQDLESESGDDSVSSGDIVTNTIRSFRSKDPIELIKKEYPKNENGRTIDVGKVFALHKAGWNDYAVSREVKCTEASVRVILGMEKFRKVFMS